MIKQKTEANKAKMSSPPQDINNLVAKVKSLKNPTAQIIQSTHVSAFAIFAVVQQIVDYLLTNLISNEFFEFVIFVIIEACLYAVIYFIVKQTKEFFINRNQKQFAIQGKWYHIHIPHTLGEIDYNHNTLRCGTTIIRRDLYDFAMSAYNYSFKLNNKNTLVRLKETNDSPKTEWHTVISEISDSTDASYDLIQIYRANSTVDAHMKIRKCPCCQSNFETEITVRKAEKFRYGIHKFKVSDSIIKSSFTRIEGTYEDCWPSLNSGEILLFRNRKERDKKALAYFNERARRLSSQASNS